MTKGKHKRNKQRAKRKRQEGASGAMGVEDKQITEDQTAAKTSKTAGNSQNPSRWERCKEYARSSPFTNQLIAAFTLVLAVAAIYQFIIMDRQLDTMRKDQRPWINLTFTSNSNALQVGYPITVEAHMVNEGKTPAKAVTGDIVVEMVKNGDELRFDYPLPHSRFTAGALFPNRPMDSPVFNRVRTASDGVSAETDPVTQAEFDEFNQVKSFVVVYGIVSYGDFFGIRHWTKMCAFFPKPGANGAVTAKRCADYGDIDSN
jgi:hypothetical protein